MKNDDDPIVSERRVTIGFVWKSKYTLEHRALLFSKRGKRISFTMYFLLFLSLSAIFITIFSLLSSKYTPTGKESLSIPICLFLSLWGAGFLSDINPFIPKFLRLKPTKEEYLQFLENEKKFIAERMSILDNLMKYQEEKINRELEETKEYLETITTKIDDLKT